MGEPKLYGIERADGTVVEGASPSLWIDRNPVALKAGVREGERVVEVALVKKDHLRALESLVRAADRMRGEASAVLSTNRSDPSDGNRYSIHGDLLLDLNGAMNDYDTQRAAVGKIGEE